MQCVSRLTQSTLAYGQVQVNSRWVEVLENWKTAAQSPPWCSRAGNWGQIPRFSLACEFFLSKMVSHLCPCCTLWWTQKCWYFIPFLLTHKPPLIWDKRRCAHEGRSLNTSKKSTLLLILFHLSKWKVNSSDWILIKTNKCKPEGKQKKNCL